MYEKAQSIYYGLAMFVLGTALFVVTPTNQPEITAIQKDMISKFDIALQRTLTDKPWFEEVGFVYEVVNSFYEQSAAATIALLGEPEADADIFYVYSQVFRTFAQAIFNSDSNNTELAFDAELSAEDFMAEEPLYNLVPYRQIVKTIDSGSVAGLAIGMYDRPVNSKAMPWITVQDNATGQLYCLAIFNDEVNKYLGPCKYDGYY